MTRHSTTTAIFTVFLALLVGSATAQAPAESPYGGFGSGTSLFDDVPATSSDSEDSSSNSEMTLPDSKPADLSSPSTSPAAIPQTFAPTQTPPAKALPSQKSEPLRSVAPKDNSFAAFFVAVMDANSAIKGKPLTLAELLEGVRGSQARQQLLRAYWALSGKLAKYNFRILTEQNVSAWSKTNSTDEILSTALKMASQRRRAAELAVIQEQWQLVEQIKRHKAIVLTEATLPIPCDYPVFKDYTTHAEKFARSQRSQQLGRMIPLQEQLVASQMASASLSIQLLSKMQIRSGDSGLLMNAANQQSQLCDEMIAAIISLNDMIGEYATETVGASVSHDQFVGTLIELPKTANPLPNAMPGRIDSDRPQHVSPVWPASYVE